MSRDHRRLEVFRLADQSVVAIYKLTAGLPGEERYGLQAQLRRAAVSVATNIVEGSARRSERDYCRFLEMAHGSAREVAYLLGLCARLELLTHLETEKVADTYDHISAMLLRIVDALAQNPEPTQGNP